MEKNYSPLLSSPLLSFPLLPSTLLPLKTSKQAIRDDKSMHWLKNISLDGKSPGGWGYGF